MSDLNKEQDILEVKGKNMIEDIQKLAKELNRTPIMSEFPDAHRALVIFKTWNNFLTEAGLKLNRVFNPYSEMSESEFLAFLKDEIERIGDVTMKAYEDNKGEDYPSIYNIKKKLDNNSWATIIEMMGLEPINKSRKNKKKETAKCKVASCDRLAQTMEYCSRHYQQILRLGYIKDEKTEKEKKEHSSRMKSKKVRINNRLGVKGVRQSENGNFAARIIVDYKEINLGTYKTLEEAIEARKNAEIKYWGKVYSFDGD